MDREERLAKRRAHREAHREEINANQRAYYQRNKGRYVLYNRKYIKAHPEIVRLQNRRYGQKHREERRVYLQGYMRSLKLETFEHYGGVYCLCCREARLEFLTLDHIAGDGAKHKRALGLSSGGGYSFYRKLKKAGFPPGLRVLCWNCNCALGQYGYCPHGNVKIESDKAVTTNGHKSQHSLQLALLDEGKA